MIDAARLEVDFSSSANFQNEGYCFCLPQVAQGADDEGSETGGFDDNEGYDRMSSWHRRRYQLE